MSTTNWTGGDDVIAAWYGIEPVLTGTTDIDGGGGADGAQALGDSDIDVDLLDLRGIGAYRFKNLMPDPKGNGFDGTIVLLDADDTAVDQIKFSQSKGFIDDLGGSQTFADHAVTAAVRDNGVQPNTTGHVAIGGGTAKDTRDLSGSNVKSITYTGQNRDDGIVSFVNGTSMTFAEVENVVPCFTPGTTIATPRGERYVEELKAGDRIITRDNGIQEIRWVGRKEISGTSLVGAPHLRPVLIKAGALGNGLPERDMMVSPNHRLLVSNSQTQLYFDENEVLAAAKHLVGGAGIHTIDVMKVSYIHFMFDRHEVVLSNGAWTESFQPGDHALKGVGNAQRTEIMELFPSLQTARGVDNFVAARKVLTKHEVKLLVDD